MHDGMKNYIQKLIGDRARRRKLGMRLCVLSLFVACGVFWQLRLTGITMADQPCCGLTEHVHTEACLEQRLICGEETAPEQPSDGGTAELPEPSSQPELTCSVEEHTHGPDCFTTEQLLVCQDSHHGEQCYEVQQRLDCREEHEHTQDCMAEQQVLICTGTHEHPETCYEERQVLSCSLEEHTHGEGCFTAAQAAPQPSAETESQPVSETPPEPAHVHTDACYETQRICGFEEEHIHSLACYSDPNQDLESPEIWEQGLPGLTGDQAHDLIAVASSQLGCRESDLNFIVAEDGETRNGITRYGQWYGNPYGDWSAMFVSFCLRYAGIDEEQVPGNSGCYAWTTQLTQKGLLRDPEHYSPVPGDLVFFDRTGDGAADHVGIVTGVDGELLKTIEGGRNDCVAAYESILGDHQLYGFVRITDEPEPEDPIDEEEPIKEEDPAEIADGTGILISGDLPEGVQAQIQLVELTLPDLELLWAFRIALVQEDGTAYEGEEIPLTVTLPMPQVLAEDPQPEISVFSVSEGEQSQPLLVQQTDLGLSFEAMGPGLYAAGIASTADLRAAAESGGEFQLDGDLTVTGATINLTKDFTLDLNGHTLTAQTGAPLFTISGGGSLTIRDSQAAQSGNAYAYQVMHSTVSGVNTVEGTLNKSVPVTGQIVAGNQPLVRMSGGSFQLESGALQGGTGRALEMSGGTADLSGGVIYGFRKSGDTADNFGGAVRVTGGQLNLSGTVLDKNSAPNGGAVYISNGTMDMTGGAISGNTSTRKVAGYENALHNGGGGIYAAGSALVQMSGGYLTLNTVEAEVYFDGGGGAMVTGSARFELSGGYVTGNRASGGAGLRTDFGNPSTILMTGGIVAGNYARSTEGGGIAIDRGGLGEIYGGYITNNTADTKHWGGGGLFCADGSTLKLKRVLVTDNSAEGFGGGIAGCPTGHIYLYIDDGYAIFDNRDVVNGTPNFVGDGVKQIDQELCTPFFQSHGHKDYFCALRSSVMGEMLGGGPVNWEGTADYNAITIGPGEVQTAEQVMGLEAHPSQEDKAVAIGSTAVFVTGNHSNTHGGGILCNGNLVVGNPENIEVPVLLNLEAKKSFRNESGENLSLKENPFSFELRDAEDNLVATGSCDEQGLITFDRHLTFQEEGTYVYTVREIPDPEHPEITYDPAVYRITLVVKKDAGEAWYGDTRKFAYYFESVKVEKSVEEGVWTQVSQTKPGKGNYLLELTGNNVSFLNTKPDSTELTVKKLWTDGSPGSASVTVDLLKDGVIIDTIVLSQENGWTHTWTDLEKGPTYTVREHPVPGYDTDYIIGDPNAPISGWRKVDSFEEGGIYLLVSADGYALTGNPGAGGAYDFNAGHWTPVSVEKGFIAPEGVTENMQWNVVPIGGKDGLYLKNLPSDGKHFLSYQNTDTVKAASTSTTYASQVISCADGLKLAKHNNDTDVKYVVKSGNNTKANTDNSNALYLYQYTQGVDESVITIVNTKNQTAYYGMDLTKVDALDGTALLPDAKFQLLVGDSPVTFRMEDGVYVYDPQGTEVDLVTGADGMLHVTGLPAGTYILRETEAPPGYLLAPDQTLVFPNGDVSTVQITVADERITYTLPETGGSGQVPYVLGGLLLMLAATLWWIKLHPRTCGKGGRAD